MEKPEGTFELPLFRGEPRIEYNEKPIQIKIAPTAQALGLIIFRTTRICYSLSTFSTKRFWSSLR